MTSTQPKLKVNVEEAFPNHRRGGDIRVCLSPKTVGCTSGFGGFVTLEAGEFVSEHYHPYSEEFLYVVSGSTTTPATLGVWSLIFVVAVVMATACRPIAVAWQEWQARWRV